MNEQLTQEVVQEKKLNKKGFSLVELIVVMAIMAILVGIVGTQVLPYIEKSRQAKDNQIISGICTAATTAFAAKAAKISTTDSDYDFDPFDATAEAGTAGEVEAQIQELMGYTTTKELTDKMESKVGKAISAVKVKYTPSTGEILVTVTGTTSSNWKDGIFDPVSSK